MFRRISLFIVLLAGSVAFGQNAPVAKDDLFQKGLAAYQSKQYAEAKDDFQKLLDQDKNDPGLLNNLALTVYQLDQKPLALALWRKALSIQPGFKPAVAGRDLLETRMGMHPFEHDGFTLSINRILESLSIYTLLWLFALAMALAGWTGLRYWGERRAALEEERELPAFPTAFAAFAIVFLAAAGALSLKLKASFKPRATVIAVKASARSLPDEQSVSLFELNGGNEVLVRRRQNGWLQVQNYDGASGWVKNSEVLVTTEN